MAPSKDYIYQAVPTEAASDTSEQQLGKCKLSRFKSRTFLFAVTFAIILFYAFFSMIIEDSSEIIFFGSSAESTEHEHDHTAKEPSEPLACRIPRLDPFDSTIKHLVKDPDPEDCTDQYPLLFESNPEFELVPTDTFAKNKSLGIDSCCFKKVVRGSKKGDSNVDNSYKFLDKCTNLSLESPYKLDRKQEEFVAILCNKTDSDGEKKDGKDVIMDMHVFVPVKPKVEERVKKYYLELENKTGSLKEIERLNVVILGIDGSSHMNFLRTMPKSYSFLMKNLSAVEFHGVNKVGDNTYPNIAAVLTYKNVSEINDTCEKSKAFDGCPFIWKEFAAQGFRTSYGEDSPWMGIFNYVKKGFLKPPTDYYLRPFSYAAEKSIGTHKKLNAKLCYGPRLTFQILLDYMKKLAHAMNHTKRYFQFIWATSLTHDYLNEGRLGDEHLLSALKWFKEGGYLNETVFILMSDHGIRWGDIRSYLQGHLEERLPFLYYVFPEWFKKKYKKAFNNLRKNQDILTTPYDLHETLEDLIHLNEIEDEKILEREEIVRVQKNETKFPRGISQFLPLPKSRTCQMAEIEEHYCTCHSLTKMKTTSSVIKQAAHFLVFNINSMISKYFKCAFLNLKKVLSAASMKSNVREHNDFDSYQISIKTSPGDAIFEASVIKNSKGDWRVAGTISRINLYGNQSHCIDNKEYKLYCFCVDLLH